MLRLNSTNILNRIINKGGIMGACAKMYINDEEKTNGFILECLKQCHNESAKKLWGEELVLDIRKYCYQELIEEELINL